MREFVRGDLRNTARQGQNAVILHLGDHDPSGIDMTRDLQEKIQIFGEGDAWRFSLTRIALNMQQIDEEKPPPNPAKATDSRFAGYAELYGDESWELDALSPTYLRRLLTEELSKHIDVDVKEKVKEKILAVRSRLEDVAEEYRDNEEADDSDEDSDED